MNPFGGCLPLILQMPLLIALYQVLGGTAKKPGLLSIRGPIRFHGPFADVDFAVAPQSIARGLGAIALGLVNPILALLPLVETGPGEDTNCRVASVTTRRTPPARLSAT